MPPPHKRPRHNSTGQQHGLRRPVRTKSGYCLSGAYDHPELLTDPRIRQRLRAGHRRAALGRTVTRNCRGTVEAAGESVASEIEGQDFDQAISVAARSLGRRWVELIVDPPRAAALEMDASDGSSQTRWRDIVAARLPSQHWPQQPVLIVAVNAHTGEPVAFDRHSGVDLVHAVAASTSNGFGPFPPYRIGENRYINGGYRRSENADLAAGYGRVLELSPFGGRSRMPLEWGMDLATHDGRHMPHATFARPDLGSSAWAALRGLLGLLSPRTRLRAT